MMRAILGAALAAVIAGAVTVRTQSTTPTELFFSEYLEGTGNNKALEIYNGTGAAVNLGASGYTVQIYFSGAATPGLTINLTGTVANGDVFVLAQAGANSEILAQANQTNSSGWFSGDDAVVLRRGAAIVDVIGQVGFDPGTEWGTGIASTADNTLRRLAAICAGDTSGSDGFDPTVEWSGFTTNAAGGLGAHTATCVTTVDAAPEVSAVLPANGAADVPVNGNLTVTFTEPVNAGPGAFSLACSSSGVVATAMSGGPTTFTLDPVSDLLRGETCVLTVMAAAVSDQDANDPPDQMTLSYTASFTTQADPCTLPYTPIPQIQGSGLSAAITGAVTTQGVVVGDYEGATPALRGFYLQDRNGDGNPATSDAIFVFNGNNDSVSLGDMVRVTGTAAEFQFQTQVSASSIHNCGVGAVTPVEVSLPMADFDAFERHEGMLVRLPQSLVVTEHFQLGRFGQVVLAAGARLQQPTSVSAPGDPALALQAANDLNRITLDDALQNQNPDPVVFGRGGQPLSAGNTLRAGDTATGIVGVMTYTWSGNGASGNAWHVRPLGALGGNASFEPANPRPEVASDVGGSLRVAGLNLLNYFNTFDGASTGPSSYACANGIGGLPTDCRGADDVEEFARQWPKTVLAIIKTGADVVAVVELENDGYGRDSALADLVNRLNSATAPDTYAYLDVDAETGQVNALGTDAIKVGLIYKPAAVVPVGLTAVLNTTSFVTGGDGEARNRPSLAQAFQTPSGGRLVAVVNHLKSKGSACTDPDAGDGQGNCNHVRMRAAQELAAWLATDPTGTGAGTLLLGDFNAYAQEDPISALRSAGFTNLTEEYLGPSAYSYGFDGQWGYLDHALASPALVSQVTGVAAYHINADEPGVLDYNTNFKSPGQLASLYAPDEFRISDHDPVIVGLDLAPSLSGHVTGGGWIMAAAGEYAPVPSAVGKVEFALAARYEPGAAVPTGRLTVTFERAGFSFVGASAQWLTLSGGQAVIQGDGTVGGGPGYSYRVTAVDGRFVAGADRLRIQVWVTATGDLVMDTGAAKPIGRGSIVVHQGGSRP